MTRVAHLLALGWLAALACSATAHADTATDRTRADQLISDGLDLRRQRRDKDALARFKEARALTPSARAAAQTGFAEQALGEWVDAEHDLQSAMTEGTDPWVAKNRDTIMRALAVVAEHLGHLELDGSPGGAEVRVNGAFMGSLPLGKTLRVPVGTATLVLSAKGHLSMTRTVTISAGELAREKILLVPLIDAGTDTAAAVEEPSRNGSPRLRLAGWSLLGVSAALLATGIAGSALRADRGARWSSDACVGNGLTRGENCASDLDAAHLGQNLAIGGYLVGGASLAAAIGLLVKGYGRPRGRGTR